MESAAKTDSFETSRARPWTEAPAEPVGAAIFLSLLMLGSAGGVTPASAQADLIVTLDPVPQVGDFRQGREKRLGVVVRNRGRRATPRGQCVKVSFRTTDGSFYFTGGDGFLGNFCTDDLDRGDESRRCKVSPISTTGWCKLSGIGAGRSKGFTLTVRPRSLGGHALITTVDPDRRIYESNERNNVSVIAVVVQ